MVKYKDYSPTQFDRKGLNADKNDIGNFSVLLIHTRDSDAMEESNFRTALRMLGGESETVQIHRFGHWACGWFELLLITPDTPQHAIAESIEQSIENYPVLDDMDFSELEIEYGEVDLED